MKISNISIRLIGMNFLQYAIWGAYLISMGSFLGKAGLQDNIWLFYAVQGFVSIFMPALIGIVADKWIPAQKTLSICHLLAGIFIALTGIYALQNCLIDPTEGAHYIINNGFSFSMFFCLYTISVAFYMPTIALSNSVAYNGLEVYGKDPIQSFPVIRVFGTVGFICSMLLVNYIKDPNGISFQNSYYQFFLSAGLGLALALYSLSLPKCPCKPKSESKSFAEVTGLSAFKLFKDRNFAIFFLFSMLLGASLQITNGYANLYINSFKSIPEYASTWGVNNANALISISQISETLCILLIPFFLKRFGIKTVMLMAMFAWVLRFGLFGLGNPGSGVILFILSCIVYGIAFDFFNISGSLYVNENTPKTMRSSAQGLFMLMTNGLGASIGVWAAGMIMNHFVFKAETPDWQTAWYIFTGYAFVVFILFALFFKDKKRTV